MTWAINLDTDGTWANGQWYSNRRVNNVPREWQYELGSFAQLAYVTEEEIELIKATGAVRYTGPGDVEFYNTKAPVTINISPVTESDVPYNWLSDKDHFIAQIIYLTRDQIYLLETADIYGSDIANNPHFGPLGIPSYQGDGGPGDPDGQSAVAAVAAGLAGLDISMPSVAGIYGWSPDSSPGAYSYYGSGGVLSSNCVIPNQNGVFAGRLTALGTMVAQKINAGSYNYVDQSGNSISSTTLPLGFSFIKPFCTGYLREYWKDPTQTILGANSAIPAITGVMPGNLTPFTGSMLYYVDSQLTRLTGSNGFDNFAYINTFNQALNWVVTSNDYTIALNKAEANSLAYFGSNSYQEFISQGFSRYQIGNALRAAIRNMGTMVTEVGSGRFGTANSVANKLLESGLGAIGQLAIKLVNANVNLNNIYSDANTQAITAVLETITDGTDLSVIQGVLKSTIPNITSPMDFTRIDVAAGQPNDSVFKTMAEFGVDLFNKAPNIVVTTGTQLASLISLTITDISQNVEALATTTSLLPPQIIQQFRGYLPVNKDNKPINILNVIGMASGYLFETLNKINTYVQIISDSPYGQQIIDALNRISDSYDKYLSFEASRGGNEFEPGPGNAPNPNDPIVAGYIRDYETLLGTVAADPTLKDTVEKLNKEYNDFCYATYVEFVNYNKANLSISNFRDPSQILTFISSLPYYAADSQGLGTDYQIRQMCQPNQAGDIVKAIMDQYKNNKILNAAGIKIRGIL